MAENKGSMFASKYTLILGLYECAQAGFLPVALAAQLGFSSNSFCHLNWIPFEQAAIYQRFFRLSKRTAYDLKNGWLIEGFVPRNLIENDSVMILYYSTETIVDGSRIGLVFPKKKMLDRKFAEYTTMTEAFYVKRVPKTHLEMVPIGNSLMEKVSWLRVKFRQRWIHLLFYFIFHNTLPNLNDLLVHIEKEATSVTHLEIGIYEMIQLKLSPYQLVPELLYSPMFDTDNDVFKAFMELLGVEEKEFAAKLLGSENVNFVDMVLNGTTFKDNFSDRNVYLWNMVRKLWKPTKFPYNWIDMVRNIAMDGVKDKNDLIEIEKLIRWNFSNQTESDLLDIYGSAINLKAKIDGDLQIKPPINNYVLQGIKPDKGDTIINDAPGGFTINGAFFPMASTAPRIFR